MTTTTTETTNAFIEIAATTAYSDTRDYGNHPVPDEFIGAFDLPVLVEQHVTDDEVPTGEAWCKWGRWKKTKQAEAWHLYCSDSKLQTLLRQPDQLVSSGARFVVEPNSSSFEDDLLAPALSSLWRKRCITRYWQDKGLKTFIDVNVEGWTRELVFEGVSARHELFATKYQKHDLSGEERGLDQLVDDFLLVDDHINPDVNPVFAVYGGGQKVQAFCDKYGWLWLPPYNHKKGLSTGED